ncbi:serine/threonine-protein kinase Nek2 [Bradysia coprophila]|uniref:serine/threonine-protein kinase Nek2 n=1 Tax=Bradysia coprophila TaxID=38358 RepID=UPI00187D8FD4|nr:serine/threonine-protein kinase Nek2 [Bradysia coprophila]
MTKLLDYEVLSVMGTGTFGTCFKVRNKLTEKIFVWKSIDYSAFDEDKKQLLVTEINLLKQLSHPNIVQYFNHILNKETKTLYIIMECCEGGDLSMLIRRCVAEKCHIEEQFIWRVLYQLSKAIQGCHSYKASLSILHRDIKPANVYLDSCGNVKLGDFGLARMLKGENNFAESVVGTPFYMSPEIIRGTKYNRKSDIWSLGCLIYELCALVPPFTGRHMESLSKNIVDGRFNRIPDMYSSDMQKIISFLLNVESGYRPSIEVILHHPTVVSNVVSLDSSLPNLVKDKVASVFTPDLSSTRNFDQDSTKDLREEIFYSVRREIFPKNASVPEQGSEATNSANVVQQSALDCVKCVKCCRDDPKEVTEDIFNEALRRRLEAIRSQEDVLKNKENELKNRERSLVIRERKIKNLERMAKEKMIKADKRYNQKIGSSTISNKENICMKPIRYDESTMSIEPNESVVMPTAAKIDSEMLRRPKEFRRIVSFKSTHKLKEKVHDQPPALPPRPTSNQRSATDANSQSKESEKAFTKKPSSTSDLTSSSSSSSSNSKDSQKVVESKRKSIFGLFGLNKVKNISKEDKMNVSDETEPVPAEVPTKWTAEHKRTAFEMLAIMNAATNGKANGDVVSDVVWNDKIIRHDKKRQSILVLKKSQENLFC